MPQVSVVIPLYNKAAYTRRAIDSVLAQSHRDFEIIVVDDGSTDGSERLVRDTGDARLRLLSQRHAGAGAARNRGIEDSKGLYIAFLDADDEWLPHYLESSLAALEANPDCDVSVSAWYQDEAEGDRLYYDCDIIDVYRSMQLELHPGPVDSSALVETKHLLRLWFTSTVMVRREVFARGYRFCDRSPSVYGEDHFMWLQLAFNHRFYRNCTPLARYHNTTQGISRGGYVNHELEAFLRWPEEILQRSFPQRRRAIRAWLAEYALESAHSRLGVGQLENAVALLESFPDMRQGSLGSYYWLRIKVLLGRLRLSGTARKLAGRTKVG